MRRRNFCVLQNDTVFYLYATLTHLINVFVFTLACSHKILRLLPANVVSIIRTVPRDVIKKYYSEISFTFLSMKTQNIKAFRFSRDVKLSCLWV